MHILLVDDEAAIRELYTLYFNTQGFDVTSASNAINALEEIYKRPYDAVMLDLGLGDSNGMDLIEPIQRAQPGVPVIIFTGLAIDAATRKSVADRGAAAILRKSYPLNYVIDEINRLVRQSRKMEG